MFEIIKYGKNQYGVWVVGHYVDGKLDFFDVFNTNIKDENYFKDKTNLPVKKFKITRNRNKQIVFSLEF